MASRGTRTGVAHSGDWDTFQRAMRGLLDVHIPGSELQHQLTKGFQYTPGPLGLLAALSPEGGATVGNALEMLPVTGDLIDTYHLAEGYMEDDPAKMGIAAASILSPIGLYGAAKYAPKLGEGFAKALASGPIGLKAQKGQFGGVNAKSADLDALEIAKEAEKSGLPKERILDATGWFRGTDGKWRFEIDDSAMSYVPSGLPEKQIAGQDYRIGKLPDSVSHSQLFEAYPELRNTDSIDYQFMNTNGTAGVYRPETRYSDPKMKTWESDPSITVWDQPMSGGKTSVAAHEIGHNIQDLEDFARGGSSDSFSKDNLPVNPVWKKWNENESLSKRGWELYNSKAYQDELAASNRLWKQEYDKRVNDLDELMDSREGVRKYQGEMQKLFDEFEVIKRERFPTLTEVEDISKQVSINEPPKYLSPDQAYRNLAGEVEARNVQNRLNLSADDRRMLDPWKTQDVPTEDQIVRYGDGPSMATTNDKPVHEVYKPTKKIKERIGEKMGGKQRGSLPMDYESRMQRADELGFTETLYKGMYPYDYTKEKIGFPGPEIEEINRPSAFPSFGGSDGDIDGIAGFLTNDYRVANRFAGGPLDSGAVYPLRYKPGKEYFIDANNTAAGNIQFGEGGKEFRDAVRSGKYDTIRILNTSDEGDITVALNPNNIRSQFAAFDPAKKDSANLLASISPFFGAGLGGLLLMPYLNQLNYGDQ